MNILGISAFFHDSATCLLKDGKIISAVQEERFTRKKHDSSFPLESLKYIIKNSHLKAEDVDYVAFYDKPFLKFERILETYLNYAPRGLKSFIQSMPIWIKEKLFLPQLLTKEINSAFGLDKKNAVDWQKKLLFPEHHQSHAASAFFPSPFENAVILTLDGVGEWATASAWVGKGMEMQPIYEINFPSSIGLLYSAFTYYLGFKVNSGEYKVMGLAPYGDPKYKDLILNNLVDLKEDGSFSMNMKYFDYCVGSTMTNGNFNKLFGAPPRKPESKISQRDMDLASSIQKVAEEIILKIARFLRVETGETNLCLAGGVALNCVANGKIYSERIFDNIWIQPASGDSGSALGAALAVWHQFLGKERVVSETDSMSGTYLGPCFSNTDIEKYLNENSIPYERFAENDLLDRVADELSSEMIIGWFQDKMEFGPRALGNRSIIGDSRSPRMQSVMNLKIKYRESFRPFAPSVIREKVNDFFEFNDSSPYMLMVAPVNKEKLLKVSKDKKSVSGVNIINEPRSDIPAVTHVDNSSRIQTVHKETNPKYYSLLKKFQEKTGCPVIVNTSFNVRGEPIVCTPEDAYKCFMRTEMDYLVLGDFLLDKKSQKNLVADLDWKKEYVLD